MIRSYRCLAPLTALWLACPSSAQETPQLTLETLLRRGPALAARSPRVLWLPDGHEATVIQAAKGGDQQLHRVVDGAVEPRAVATAAELCAALGIDPGEAPARFPPVSWHDQDTLRVELADAVWRWDLGASKARRVLTWSPPSAGASPFREPGMLLAPGDGHAAVRRDHQVFLHAADGSARQLTFDGSEHLVYGGAAHRAEIGITRGLFWSDDGRYLVRVRDALVSKYGGLHRRRLERMEFGVHRDQLWAGLQKLGGERRRVFLKPDARFPDFEAYSSYKLPEALFRGFPCSWS